MKISACVKKETRILQIFQFAKRIKIRDVISIQFSLRNETKREDISFANPLKNEETN